MIKSCHHDTFEKMRGQSDWQAAAAIPEDTIDDSDFNWGGAVLLPKRKVAKTLRLDPEMLAWFQQQGRGYQTRMNAVLCAYYRASVTGG
ncbi:MAG: BrnA antitoxin family protein [Holosporales bacterium]